jgi:transcriptional regulator with XRE-family HTH domain
MDDKLKKEKLIAMGTFIRRRRKEIGLSQEEFADKAQLHRTYISSIEQGKRNIAYLNLLEIIYALNLSPATFFNEIISIERENENRFITKSNNRNKN